MPPNPYERGRRDGERGLERANAYNDDLAHEQWAKHIRFHDLEEPPECGLECSGVHTIKETLRKRLKQSSDGLPRFRHTCCECKAVFRTESLAALREQYNAGYDAGFGLFSSAQSRRRNDLARRGRRRMRRSQ